MSAEPKDSRNTFLELVVVVAVALGLALVVQAFLVKPYRIPSRSMEPTLDVGQRVLADRVRFHFVDPSRGDVVVFKPPAGAESSRNECGRRSKPGQACPLPITGKSTANFIKRIVALPGDRLTVKRGRVYINGRLNDPWRINPDASCPVCNLPVPVTVPRGYYFMMGDNRGQSDDSRYWGPVPRSWLIGKAFFTYWPPKRIGTL
jgi:signal peptidase I